MSLHVVIGTGAVGATLTALLAARGHHVRVVSRSGTPGGPAPSSAPGTPEPFAGPGEQVEHVAADAADAAALTPLARGAEVLYDCAGPAYHRWPQDWPPLHRAVLDTAEATGAVLVTATNLYAHGPGFDVLREDTPLASTERKGRVRAWMWREAAARHAAGRVRATEVRAADYVGPLATDQSHGSRFVGPLLAGRTVRPVGDPDVPHAVTYLPDLARALAAAGTRETAWGRPWIAPTGPALTVRERVASFAAAAGLPTPRVAPVGRLPLELGALTSPVLREVRRVSAQFTEPFVVDSSLSERALGLTPTPWDEIVTATLAWWRETAPLSR